MLIKFEPSAKDLQEVVNQFRPGSVELYFRKEEFYIRFTDEWLVKNNLDNSGGSLLYYMALAIDNPPVYEGDLNADHLVTSYYRIHHPDISVDEYYSDGYKYEYGVADSPKQLLEDYTVQMDFINSKEKYICYFTWIKKEDQPPSGGWQWRKWGEYIGKQKPRHEYLYNEPDIDAVIVFHFLRINDGINNE